MELITPTLSARKGAWLRFSGRRKRPAFQSAQKKIFNRDNHTCRFCGFKCEKFNEVVNIDHNYDNNKANNMATACPFCTQCLFLDGLGMTDEYGGIVIYLPEMSQADLNNFCRVLFCSLEKNSPYKSRLQAVYLSLKDRASIVEKALGPDTSTPNVFGQALLDCGLTPDQISPNVIGQLRLLPIRSYFKKQINYWNRTIYSRFPL